MRGGNFPGMEATPSHLWSPGNPWGDQGGVPDWATYATWKPTIARIPLNAAAWLNIPVWNITGAEGSPAWDTTTGAMYLDPQGNYKQYLYDAIASLQAIGCYVILDLHWCAAKISLGGTAHYLRPEGQSPFMDYDTAIPFWDGISKTFGTNVAPPTSSYGPISNQGIMFELFNEPYLDSLGGYTTGSGGTGSSLSYDQACHQGGYCPTTINGTQNGTNYQISAEWHIAGYADALAMIRGNGAENILIMNGNDYSKKLVAYGTYGVADTLANSQVAYGWHPYPTYGSTYPSGSYVYSGSNDYPYGQGNANCVDPANTILRAGFPLICTEDGGYGGRNATSGEPHMAFFQNWVDSVGASYVFWQWNGTRAYGTTGTNNYATVYAADGITILPIEGEGVQTYDWMFNHA